MKDDTVRASWLDGWHLLYLISALLIILTAAMLMHEPGVIGVRSAAVSTALCSFILFLSSFTASAVYRIWPTPLTRWQLTNRRYLGLALAFSHTIHLAAVITFAWISPEIYATAKPVPVFAVLGGIGYLFLWVMAATSSRRATVWLGMSRWRLLHRTGIYYLWSMFLAAFGTYLSHHPTSTHAIAALLLLLVAFALRIIASRFSRQYAIAPNVASG